MRMGRIIIILPIKNSSCIFGECVPGNYFFGRYFSAFLVNVA